MTTWMRDFLLAWRMLVGRPGFALTVLVTLRQGAVTDRRAHRQVSVHGSGR
jgi:hypothetical protein